MKKHKNHIKTAVIRASKIHVFLAIAFIVQIAAYDAGKIITPDVVTKRWIATSLLLAAGVLSWYFARLWNEKRTHIVVWSLVAIDIAVASFYVDSTRGMASRAVFLYALPVLTAATLQRKGAIYLTAALSAAAYLLTAVEYFWNHFNEGYKLELYGEIGFYAAFILCIGGLAWSLVKSKH